ncbi:PGAP1-domain-containing protein [Meredithblackwellia eburnea MCA 4105]
MADDLTPEQLQQLATASATSDSHDQAASLTLSTFSHRPNHSAMPHLSSRLWILIFSSFVTLAAIGLSYTASQPVYPPGSLAPDARGQGAGACRMSYMSPSYMRMEGFGREYTRLGSGPWGLYLYREAGWDDEPYSPDGRLALTGTPVVFVPGNAGSFRQVRSLASAASRSWWELPGVRRKGGIHPKEGGRPLDFFTLDFNDDFSAFHGQTLLDQAEYLADSIRYILSLYHQQPGAAIPDPSSVIVVAHSMGGIVARAAFLHPHFQAHSISTLITFATPHVTPPVSVDRNVDRVYDHVNTFWRRAYGLTSSTAEETIKERAALEDVYLVSIGGGISDITIASESVSLSSLVPLNDSNGFSVFTTAIPGVNTPVDHLAILWCQQLMQTVASSVLSIVDVRTPRGVLSLEERRDRLSSRLLGRVESTPKRPDGRTVPLSTLERGIPAQQLDVGQRLVVPDGARGENERLVQVLPIPPVRTYGSALEFTLLSSSSISRGKDSSFEVYSCSSSAKEAGENETECTPLFPGHVTAIPTSPHSDISPILPAPMEDGTMSLLSVSVDQLSGMSSIAVVIKPGSAWAVAEFGDREKRVHGVSKSAFGLMIGGAKLDLSHVNRALVSEVWIPALDTSLLTLKLNVFRGECQNSRSLFAPMVRQWSPLVHESKYFPNVRVASLYTHASGPFQPAPSSPFASSGTRLHFLLDPTCASNGSANSEIAVEVTVDMWATLGALVMRYRMMAVAYPFSIVMLVMARQMKEYNSGHPFVPFGTGLSLFVKDTFFPLGGLLTGGALLQSVILGTHHSASESLFMAEPNHAYHITSPPRWVSDAFVGAKGMYFLGLGAFLALASIGLVALEYLVLQALVSGAAFAVRLAHTRGPAFLRHKIQIVEPHESLPVQRVVSMGALLLLVLFFAPYQFAFLVIFLVHFFSTVRALLLAQDISASSTPLSTKRLWDRYHYSFAILLIMMCLIPITALILVVWVRNLAVGWLAPFSSDHNVMYIVGFIFNVEALHSGKMIPRSKGRLPIFVSSALPTLCAAYGFVYGIRYAHHIYPFTNSFFLWLAAGNSEIFVGAAYEAVVGKRRASQPPSRRVATTDETTKRTLD